MEKMDKGLTVPKWVLIVRPKVPQTPQNLSAQFVLPSRFQWKKASLGVRSQCKSTYIVGDISVTEDPIDSDILL